MKPVTICLTYFRSLTLANLDAALYALRQQDFWRVDRLIVFDNNTVDAPAAIQAVVDAHQFPVPVTVQAVKHGIATRTHAWSTNQAVSRVETPWVFFTRADYVLAFDAIQSFTAEMGEHPDGFITSDGCHLAQDVHACERSPWRTTGPQFVGATFDYTCIDAGVWLLRRQLFEQVGGLDERLTAWGHAQTEFQYRLHRAGVGCVRIPRVLFFHPHHGGPRDLRIAHQQLAAQGGDLRAMWARYEGASPY